MKRPRLRFAALVALASTSLALTAAVTLAQTNTVDAVNPTSCITPVHTSATVPINITRTDNTAMLAFSVTFTLSPELVLGTPPAITEGNYLNSVTSSTSFLVRNLGGGQYAADGAILGAGNCGPTSATGTLFNIKVTNSGGSGTGSITINSVTLRDCSNGSLPSTIGSAASVTIDLTPVVVAPISNQTIAESSLLTVTPAVTLSSCVTGPASWTATGLPTGASVDPGTGIFTWTPDCRAFENGPDYGPVTLTALAASGETGSASFSIHVANTLGSVALDPITDPQVVAELATLTVTPNATLTGCAMTPLSWTATGLPAGAAIDPGTGVVTWTPSCSAFETNGGVYGPVTITAHALEGEVASRSFSIHVTDTPVAISKVTALAGTQVTTGNGPGGLTGITVSFTSPVGATAIEVYRAPFGNYPEYDDAPGSGSVPVAPSYPPSGSWTLTSVTASGQVDHPPSRDFWYYVAFAKNACGDVSLVSDMTTGTLDYDLGDVSDGFTLGAGDNLVNTADLSTLGAHYGLTGAAVAAYNYLDVGPTTTGWVDGRPFTDDQIDFEDLVIFALNYGGVSMPQARVRPVASASQLADRVMLGVPDQVSVGDVVSARLLMSGSGAVRALSTRLSWDPTVVEPQGMAAGDWLLGLGGVALSGKPGMVDAAALSPAGLVGEGALATVTFRAIAAGDPGIRIESADARDAGNHPIGVAQGTLQAPRIAPTTTRLSAVVPNPFHDGTTLGFSLAKAGLVDLSIYSVDGRRVRTLVHESREPDVYRVSWDGRGDSGALLAAGVYYVRLTTAQGRFSRMISFMR